VDQPVEAQQSCKCDKRGCRLGEEKKSQNDSCKPLEQKDPPNLGQVFALKDVVAIATNFLARRSDFGR